MLGLAKCFKRIFLALIFLLLILNTRLIAHETHKHVFFEGMVGIKAYFSLDEPLAQTSVLIFAPDQTEATFETSTDHKGVVCIAPDRPGIWIVQVRGAGGHGVRVDVKVDESMIITASPEQSSGELSFLQKALIILCVVWGLVGTALFFKTRIKR